MPYICLSEVITATSFASTSGSATNAPVANLGSFNLALPWIDTTAATGNGFTFSYGGTSYSVWAATVARMNTNDPDVLSETNWTIKLSSDATYAGVNLVAQQTNTKLVSDVVYSLTSSGNRDRQDALVVFGVDTIDSGGPTVTGIPATQAHKSGQVLWVQTNPMADGYHRAGCFAAAVNKLVFRAPNMAPKPWKGRHGWGWEVQLTWDFLQAEAATEGGVAVKGYNELCNLVSREQPVMAVLNLSGLDANGAPKSSHAAPWHRLGLARIVEFDLGDVQGPRNTYVGTYAPRMLLRTWEEE